MPAPSFAYLCERFPSFVQTFVYREVEEMARQGMEPLVFSIRRPENPTELTEPLTVAVQYFPDSEALRAEIDKLNDAGKLPANVHRAIGKARKEKDSNRVFEAAWLGPQLRREGIKHVHAHFAGIAARTAWWLRELYGISYSFTGHANDIFCENQFSVSNGDLVRDASFIVAVTDFARQWLEKKYPRAQGRIFRVYNGVDRNFPPWQPAGDPPLILSVGRYVEKKGFDDLIEACVALRERGRAFRCEIVGEGPIEAALKAQISRAGLERDVILTGPLPQSEVRRRLASAQAFVLACVPENSGGSDNLPTVVMEAMMCGVPVVSTRVAGLPEMIQHGENGLLVAPRTASALALALEQLLRDNVLATKFGSRGHGTAVAKFSSENTTRALKHLLVRHAGVKPPPRAADLDPTLPRGLMSRWFG